MSTHNQSENLNEVEFNHIYFDKSPISQNFKRHEAPKSLDLNMREPRREDDDFIRKNQQANGESLENLNHKSNSNINTCELKNSPPDFKNGNHPSSSIKPNSSSEGPRGEIMNDGSLKLNQNDSGNNEHKHSSSDDK